VLRVPGNRVLRVPICALDRVLRVPRQRHNAAWLRRSRGPNVFLRSSYFSNVDPGFDIRSGFKSQSLESFQRVNSKTSKDAVRERVDARS